MLYGSPERRAGYMGMGVDATCLGAEKSFTQRNIVTGVVGRNDTVLLLPAVKIARLPSKLGWLVQFSKAILDGGGKQTHKRTEKHRGRLAATQ